MVGRSVEVSFGRPGNELVIVLRGEFDLVAIQPLRTALLDACRDQRTVTVDFEGVTFFDAATLGQLAAAAARLSKGGTQLNVVGVRPRQAEIFRLAGLRHLLAMP